MRKELTFFECKEQGLRAF